MRSILHVLLGKLVDGVNRLRCWRRRIFRMREVGPSSGPPGGAPAERPGVLPSGDPETPAPETDLSEKAANGVAPWAPTPDAASPALAPQALPPIEPLPAEPVAAQTSPGSFLAPADRPKDVAAEPVTALTPHPDARAPEGTVPPSENLLLPPGNEDGLKPVVESIDEHVSGSDDGIVKAAADESRSVETSVENVEAASGRSGLPDSTASDGADARTAGEEPEKSQSGSSLRLGAQISEPIPDVTGSRTTSEGATRTNLAEISSVRSVPSIRTQRRPRPRSRAARVPRSVDVSAPPIEERDYLSWNRAIVEHSFGEEASDEDAFLAITPTILAGALSRVESSRVLAEEAEYSFVEAVAGLYHRRVLNDPSRLGVLRRIGPEELPDCAAFLAASVLAAYRMQTDEETTAAAYYLRLAEILKVDLVGGHPNGFDPVEFEALWQFLERWLRERRGRRLAMPGPDVGLRRFVAFPLTHVPLRRVDIERLPDFFVWAGYEPGARIQRQRLDQDLASWTLGRPVFTMAGRAALADERRGAVLAQIAQEVEAWDGSYTDTVGRQSARVEVLLDVVQRQPELFLLARRPPRFPATFDAGTRLFEAADEGWYDPVALQRDDGDNLTLGFAWEVASAERKFLLRRPGATAIALPPSPEYTGYLSQRALRLGVPCAALCRDNLEAEASRYLSEVSQGHCASLNHPAVPAGWRLFTGIKPVRHLATSPSGLEALAVEHAVDLIPRGGLRLGGRWAWIAGAPPTLMVAGLLPGDAVTIDGGEVGVDENGVLLSGETLTRPGSYLIEAGGLRRRVEIVEPQARNATPSRPLEETAVGLPSGRWTLIGSLPGQVASQRLTTPDGAIAFCAFTPIWAIEVGAGPGATVLCLCRDVPKPAVVKQVPSGKRARRRLGSWASVIYSAAIRHPRLLSIHGDDPTPAIRDGWTVFSRAAGHLKRRLRRRHP